MQWCIDHDSQRESAWRRFGGGDGGAEMATIRRARGGGEASSGELVRAKVD